MSKPSSKKKLEREVRFEIPAGEAKPGKQFAILGQYQVPAKMFCDAFNAATQKFERSTPIRALVRLYADKSFDFVAQKPPTTYYLLKAAGLSKGSSAPGRGYIGKVTMNQIRDIAREKISDLSANDEEAACRIVMGSARSMSLEVVESV